MNKLIGLAPLVIILAACAPLAQRAWEKSGASRDDFARDRYACLQQSQQNASSAYVNAYAGQAQAGVVTNGGLFDACMNANGWYLGTVQPTYTQPVAPRSAYVNSQQFTDNNREICKRNNTTEDDIQACMHRLAR